MHSLGSRIFNLFFEAILKSLHSCNFVVDVFQSLCDVLLAFINILLGKNRTHKFVDISAWLKVAKLLEHKSVFTFLLDQRLLCLSHFLVLCFDLLHIGNDLIKLHLGLDNDLCLLGIYL